MSLFTGSLIPSMLHLIFITCCCSGTQNFVESFDFVRKRMLTHLDLARNQLNVCLMSWVGNSRFNKHGLYYFAFVFVYIIHDEWINQLGSSDTIEGFKKNGEKIKGEYIKRMQNAKTCKLTKSLCVWRQSAAHSYFFIQATLPHSNFPLYPSIPLSLYPSLTQLSLQCFTCPPKLTSSLPWVWMPPQSQAPGCIVIISHHLQQRLGSEGSFLQIGSSDSSDLLPGDPLPAGANCKCQISFWPQ